MISLFFSDEKMAKSIERYLRYTGQIEEITILHVDSPYQKKDAFDKAIKCDLLIGEGFFDNQPRGFQFAKAMGKNAILVFYTNELEIEMESPSWLILPDELPTFSQKVKSLTSSTSTVTVCYEEMERRFPVLREMKQHK